MKNYISTTVKYLSIWNYDVNSYENDFKMFLNDRRNTFAKRDMTISFHNIIQDENIFSYRYIMKEEAEWAFISAFWREFYIAK